MVLVDRPLSLEFIGGRYRASDRAEYQVVLLVLKELDAWGQWTGQHCVMYRWSSGQRKTWNKIEQQKLDSLTYVKQKLKQEEEEAKQQATTSRRRRKPAMPQRYVGTMFFTSMT